MVLSPKKSKVHEQDQVHRQERDFRVIARRNKLLGHWAAERLGITGAEADVYAKQVVSSDLEEPGDEDVIRKVLGDFESRGVALERSELEAEMETLLDEARNQIADS